MNVLYCIYELNSFKSTFQHSMNSLITGVKLKSHVVFRPGGLYPSHMMFKLLLSLTLLLEIFHVKCAEIASQETYSSESDDIFFDPFLNDNPNHFDELYKPNKRPRIIPNELLYPFTFNFGVTRSRPINTVPENIPAKAVPVPAVSRAEKMYGLDNLGDLSEVLVKEWSFEVSKALLLDRYRLETGLSYSPEINWDYLDRSQIPERYAGVVINSKSLECDKIYKNSEIIYNIHFVSQINPQQTHKAALQELWVDLRNLCAAQTQSKFGYHRCIVHNWPEDVDLTKRYWNSDEITRIKSCMNVLKFEVPQVESSDDQLKIWRIESKNLRDDLFMIFREQHPGKRFLFKNYDIQFWPEDVRVDKYDWTRREIQKIRENIDKLRFIEKTA